jgi:hypothetical protein
MPPSFRTSPNRVMPTTIDVITSGITSISSALMNISPINFTAIPASGHAPPKAIPNTMPMKFQFKHEYPLFRIIHKLKLLQIIKKRSVSHRVFSFLILSFFNVGVRLVVRITRILNI